MSGEQSQEWKEFNSLYKEIDDIYHDMSLRAGMSDSAFLIFCGFIQLGEGCTQKDIAEFYFISRQTVNSSIKNLERKGYVFFEQETGRDKHLYVTPAGREFADKYVIPVIEAENSAFFALSPEERGEFLRLNRKYITGFRKKVSQI